MSDKKAGKSDIVHRLCEKAAMIHLGEKIEFGTETRLMWEAADEIERLRAALAAGRARILEEAALIAGQMLCEGSNIPSSAVKYVASIQNAIRAAKEATDE